MKTYQLVIIGGGPAGIAAAIRASKEGQDKILLLERNAELGGILNQCIHDGFGVQRFGEALTGPEYIDRFENELRTTNVEIKTNAMVTGLTKDRLITYVTRNGVDTVKAEAVILATGCRERTRGAIAVPGSRPAGIYTAGVLQHLINLQNIKVGKRAVILGSGDIGLIMARRLTLEGTEVLCVLEKLPYSSGLPRNIRQCLEDFQIPLYLNRTVVDIRGKSHLEQVVVADVDEKGVPKMDTCYTIDCDTLVLSVGLIPENEIAKACGIEMDPITGGALVDGRLMTSVEGIFSCGNGLHVHDLVDMVSDEAERAASNAASFVMKKCQKDALINIRTGKGVRYVLPRSVPIREKSIISMRVSKPDFNKFLVLSSKGKVLAKKKILRISPAEMLRMTVPELDDTEELEVSICDQ